MNQNIGWIKEKIGRTVDKAMILRKVADIRTPQTKLKIVPKTEGTKEQDTYETVYIKPDGTETLKLEEANIILKPMYRVVHQEFFSGGQMWLRWDGKTYPLELTGECYTRGQTHVHFFEYESANKLDMSGITLATKSPLDWNLGVDCEHIKNWKKSNALGNDWVLYAVFIALGIFIGFVIGQNIEGITSTLNGPAPTPIVVP